MAECKQYSATTYYNQINKNISYHYVRQQQQSSETNVTVRQSPAYSSQSQGSVESFHRALMGQRRTLKAQLEANYDISIESQHPIIPWLVRHSAYLRNRYATHTDGNTSFYRRWSKEHRTPLCEFGEAVLYQLPHVKDLPKLENRFLPAIWRGLAKTQHQEKTPGNSSKSHTLKNNQETANAREIRWNSFWNKIMFPFFPNSEKFPWKSLELFLGKN